MHLGPPRLLPSLPPTGCLHYIFFHCSSLLKNILHMLKMQARPIGFANARLLLQMKSIIQNKSYFTAEADLPSN